MLTACYGKIFYFQLSQPGVFWRFFETTDFLKLKHQKLQKRGSRGATISYDVESLGIRLSGTIARAHLVCFLRYIDSSTFESSKTRFPD